MRDFSVGGWPDSGWPDVGFLAWPTAPRLAVLTNEYFYASSSFTIGGIR